MKNISGLFALFAIYLMTLTACCNDSEREKYDEKTYSDILSSLVIENTDLQTISDFTNNAWNREESESDVQFKW